MKIQIVDERDQVVGVKERSDVDSKVETYRMSALWLTNSKGQILLAKRAMVKSNDPGKWGPAVAGTIDEGETYDVNIYKEAEEEIGLRGVEFSKGIKTYTTYPGNYFCQWFFATLDRDASSFKLQAEEVDKIEWVDIEKLKHEIEISPEKYVPLMPQIIKDLNL